MWALHLEAPSLHVSFYVKKCSNREQLKSPLPTLHHHFLPLHTATLATPESLEVTASSPSSLRVRWRPAHGATQYMALYSALNDGEPDDAREVNLGSAAC